MVGGQVLIIFVGGEAFRIVPLNGKEWGLSVGLGAISLPWGAIIRMFPDAWASALVPKVKFQLPAFMKRRKPAQLPAKDLEQGSAISSDEQQRALDGVQAKGRRSPATPTVVGADDFVPPMPLRTLTSIRGKRAQTHMMRRGFRAYMRDQTVKVKEMTAGGSKTDVSTSGPSPAAAAHRPAAPARVG